MGSPLRGGRAPDAASYAAGVAMVLAAGICLSFGGLILRHVESADIWLVVFFRSITFFATLTGFLALRYRGGLVRLFLEIRREGVVVALLMGGGSICYLLAIDLTTVANVVFILSVGPLVTAVLGLAVLGERVAATTWAAMAAALIGIAVMAAGGMGSGRLAGNLVAFGAVLAFSGMVIAIRRAKAVDMVPAIALGGVLAGAFSLAMIDGFAISGHDLMLAVLLGTAQLGAGFLLITLGTRAVPAAEVPLLAMTEVVFAPLWVWLWVDEVPSGATLTGGAIVLSAVAGAALLRLRAERARLF